MWVPILGLKGASNPSILSHPKIGMPPTADSGDSNGPDTHFTIQNRSRTKSPKNPPRPPNSYMVFLSHLRDTHAHAPSKITTSLAGKLWRDLSPEKKQYYHALSVAAKKQHALQYPTYALQPKKGSDRRPYGSRKTSAQRGSINAVGTSVSHTKGPAAASPSRSEHQQPQSHIELAYPSCDTFGTSSSPQAVDPVLGLYDFLDPILQPPFPFSFPSPPAPLDLQLVPTRIPGLSSPPSHSPYSTSTPFPIHTPPTLYRTSFTPCTTSLDSPSQYPSPLLYFQRLSLEDQIVNHTFTSNSPLALITRPVLLPEIQTPDYDYDYDLFSFSDLPDHPQEEFTASP